MRLRVTWVTAALLGLAPVFASAQSSSVRLSGRIITNDGSPVADAEIVLGGLTASGRSDSAGRFLVEGTPVGPVRLQVRAIGFSPLDTIVVLPAGESPAITLRMVRSVQQLEPVITEAVLPYGKPLRYQHTGRFDDFYERRAKRPGTFFTREDIERSGRNNAMELMSSVAGVRLNWREDGTAIVRVARCEGKSVWYQRLPLEERYRWLAVYIDGQRIGAAIETLSQLKAGDIETMEVYRGPSQLPVDAVGDACAAVFITTRFTTGSVLPKK